MSRQHLLWFAAIIAAAVAAFFLHDPLLRLISPAPPPVVEGGDIKPDTTIVRPLTGTLRILVPEGVIGTDYWIYINEHLVSGPPRQGTTRLTPADLWGTEEGGHYIIHDDQGVAMETDGARITFLRDDLKHDSSLFAEASFPVAPGAYEVGVMIRGSPSTAPFSIILGRTSVSAGQDASVMLAAPQHSLGMRAVAPYITVICDPAEIQQHQSRYQMNPVARALVEVHGNLASNPPQESTTIVQMPAELGGPREYNAEQIDEMIRWLQTNYGITVVAGCVHLDQINDFNRQIGALGEISRKLRDAGAAASAAEGSADSHQ